MKIEISVVIPTCNRRDSLMRLLASLNLSTYPIYEVVIVDSSDEAIHSTGFNSFNSLHIQHIISERSVCIQRNIGIRASTSPLIFICDDDLEVPPDYLYSLTDHLQRHPEAGAVTGIVLQKDSGEWTEQYPIKSGIKLFSKFVFQSSIWGSIVINDNTFLNRYLKHYYKRKGNHIAKSGWPVITDFSTPYFKTPIYGLGASLIKKEWLINSLYDEVLDAHGIGDNYGVALGFPSEGIHVIRNAMVYHYQESENRLNHPLIYYRRILALDYFIKTKAELRHIKTKWFLWTLAGNVLFFIFSGNVQMLKINFKVMVKILGNKNPYIEARKIGKRVVTPVI